MYSILEETTDYLSDVIGDSNWGEEARAVHGRIMYNAIQELAENMNMFKK